MSKDIYIEDYVSDEQEAAIIGWWRMGARIDQIAHAMNFPYAPLKNLTIIENVIADYKQTKRYKDSIIE